MDIVLIVFGFVILITGGELFVRGAVSVARTFGVSPMVIGLTLVGFGTSMPELATSLQAALAGSSGIALGNVVGSNTANLLLILGVAALLGPIAVEPGSFRRDGTILLIVTALCILAAVPGTYTRLVGIAFLAILAFYVLATLKLSRSGPQAKVLTHEAESLPARDLSPLQGGLFVMVGLAAILIGARLLVTGAIGTAIAFGISESVIGLTVVAVGTSLPELVTSAVAARRGESDVAFGNVIGSNIFNILGILGATAAFVPLAVPPGFFVFDFWVMAAATGLAVLVARTGCRINRREGLLLVALYSGYTVFLVVTA